MIANAEPNMEQEVPPMVKSIVVAHAKNERANTIEKVTITDKKIIV